VEKQQAGRIRNTPSSSSEELSFTDVTSKVSAFGVTVCIATAPFDESAPTIRTAKTLCRTTPSVVRIL
jgi:hypothetical protein